MSAPAKSGGGGGGSSPTKEANTSNIELYSPKYFFASALGGAVACGPTHSFVTPLDVVKTNAQSNPKVFKGTISGLRNIYAGTKEVAEIGFAPGLRGVLKGWTPTFWGYSIQGAGKYGFYEFFKHQISERISDDNAKKYRDFVAAGASAGAEFIADIGLCPFEAVKVRIQTNPSYANGVMDGMPKMVAEGGIGLLYGSLGPLWARQIPYTICKFVAFERIADELFKVAETKFNRPKKDMSKAENLGVVFTAGYLAGIICATVSHPADTMVSKINYVKSEGSLWHKMTVIYSGEKGNPGIGFKGLWSGLGTRCVMVGTLTGLQWFIYGAFKTGLGLPTPGG